MNLFTIHFIIYHEASICLIFYLLSGLQVEYNQKQIRTLLQMIDVGNRPKASRSYDKGISGLHHRGSAFGIVGNYILTLSAFQNGTVL